MYDRYRRLASQLGMRLLPEDPGMATFELTLAGEIDRQPVSLRRLCGSGARIDITAPLELHLDLGLGVYRAGLRSRVAQLLGTRDIQVGDGPFDDAFAVRGDEPERVRALLTAPLCAELMAVGAPQLELSDAEASSRWGVEREDPEHLEHAMREVARVARRASELASALPPALALRAHHEAWSKLALECGLRCDASPLRLSGWIGSTWILVRAHRKTASEFSIELCARLEQPLPEPLLVRRRPSGLAALVRAKGQPTGDARFDEAFHVDAAGKPEWLDAEVRARLLELDTLGPVVLDAQRIDLRTDAARLEPGRVAAVVDGSRSVLDGLARAAKSGGAAYR